MPSRVCPFAHSSLQRPQLQAEGDDPLLRSVVQIAFETPARLIRRGDDARA